jgi:hypothetical protein
MNSLKIAATLVSGTEARLQNKKYHFWHGT